MSAEILDSFREVEVVKPSNQIINQIKSLISSGQLKPGDKLPSERVLSEKFGLGRTHVRDAIKKLEFYGILKTLPQSGTVVAGLGMTALEGLISNVLEVESPEFTSLVETRVLLEAETARLAAIRHKESDLKAIEDALDKYQKKATSTGSAVEEDMMFHLKIAEASHNQVLKSLLLTIMPDILSNFGKYHICEDDHAHVKMRFDEHKKLFNCIANSDPDGAQEAMRYHLRDIVRLGEEIASGNMPRR